MGIIITLACAAIVAFLILYYLKTYLGFDL